MTMIGSCTNLADLLSGGSGMGAGAGNGGPGLGGGGGGGLSSLRRSKRSGSERSLHSESTDSSLADKDKDGNLIRPQRIILISNNLPIRGRKATAQEAAEGLAGGGTSPSAAANLGWIFEWDEDALVGQIKLGVLEQQDGGRQLGVLFVGQLNVDIPENEQDVVSEEIYRRFGCIPVFIPSETKDLFYKGFCKSILWPTMHYLVPLTPKCGRRFDRRAWQAYIAANKCFVDRVVEFINPDDDMVWIHDYHLIVLPTLLRKRFHALRIGYFLHCPFPSSEVFRAMPCRDELLRSMLNADVIGFHTYDYARHFLSCINRALGVDHESKRGTIGVMYYGRRVVIRISPTGVHCGRLLQGFDWPECEWRRGELIADLQNCTVALGVDDLDVFKGIDLKIEAVGRMLDAYPGIRGKFTLIQVVNAPRSLNAEVAELRDTIRELTEDINRRHGQPGADGKEAYKPIQLIERHVPLHERIALYSVADVFVVSATRDGMNLFPYEYIVCRQGPPQHDLHDSEEEMYGMAAAAAAAAVPAGGLGSIVMGGANSTAAAGADASDADGAPRSVRQRSTTSAPPPPRDSMLVVSEFVGCSPSLSGALRVNPYNTDGFADALHSACTIPLAERRVRHKRHWEYVRGHTAQSWGATFVDELWSTTRDHSKLRCHGLGFGLQFRVVALDETFKKLDAFTVLQSYQLAAAAPDAARRLFMLDYDGTLTVGVIRGQQQGGPGSSTPGQDIPTQGMQRVKSSQSMASTGRAPSAEVLDMLRGLCKNENNVVAIVSGRSRLELSHWFLPAGAPGSDGGGNTDDLDAEAIADPLNRLMLCAEHGMFYRYPSRGWRMAGMAEEEMGALMGSETTSAAVSAMAVSADGADGAAGSSLAPPVSYGQVFHTASDGVDVVGLPFADADTDWRSVALPVLRQYAECTDGAHVEAKETSLVWRYTFTDAEFGGRQAKELMDHLEDVLAHDHSVEVVRGSGIVEVKPVEATKGNCVRRIITQMNPALPRWCLCVGDDQSDESMFTTLEELLADAKSKPSGQGMTRTKSALALGSKRGDEPAAEVWTATVGSKPSAAHYFVNDPVEVVEMLRSLGSK